MATLKQIADEIGDALNRFDDWMFKERIKAVFRHEAATIVRQAIDKDGIDDMFKTKFGANISIVDDSDNLCGSTCGVIRTDKLPIPVRYKTDEPFTFVGSKDGKIVYIYSKLAELPYANLVTPYSANPIRYIYQNGYIYINDGELCGSITSIVDYSATIPTSFLITTTSEHGLKTGYKVQLLTSNSGLGIFEIVVISSTSFYVISSNDLTAAIKWTRELSSDECISLEGVFPLGDVLDKTPEVGINKVIIDDNTTLPIPEDLIQAIKMKLLAGEFSILDDKDKEKDNNLDN